MLIKVLRSLTHAIVLAPLAAMYSKKAQAALAAQIERNLARAGLDPMAPLEESEEEAEEPDGSDAVPYEPPDYDSFSDGGSPPPPPPPAGNAIAV